MSEFWNARYRAAPEAFGAAPNDFLAGCAGMLPRAGRALVPGDGQGRNGLWLARRGLRPLLVDLSEVGLAQARERAAAEGLAIETRRADIAEIASPGAFALCASIFVHLPPERRAAGHARMAEALAPGGLLILESYAPGHEILRAEHQSGGPPDPAMLHAPEALRGDFAGLEELFLEVIERRLAEGRFHDGPGRVVRAIFRKP